MHTQCSGALGALGELVDAIGQTSELASVATADALSALAAAPDARSVRAICAVLEPRAREIAHMPTGHLRQVRIAHLTTAANVLATVAAVLAAPEGD